MPTNALILFFYTLASGVLVFFLPSISKKNFKPLLTFSGAYLFSITVIHILPELFENNSNPLHTGIGILVGFFLQMLLEFFSEGVEHGHMHTHGHHPHASATVLLLLSMGVHSFLEGTLLVHPTSFHEKDDVQNLMAGMMVHKLPEALALSAVLLYQVKKKWLVFLFLVLFSMATPLGLMASDFLVQQWESPWMFFHVVFPVVAGNFLYISTTIFFESGPEHTFKANKVIFSLLGASIAVLAEWWL